MVERTTPLPHQVSSDEGEPTVSGNTRKPHAALAKRTDNKGRPKNNAGNARAPFSGQRPRNGHPKKPNIESKHGSSQWARRKSYAAIDLGTNNCRLLIAKPEADGFIVVDAFSRVVRLGEGLSQTGKLSDKAMDRAVAALSICADKLRRRHVTLARSVATQACRQAHNGQDFIDRVKRETGIVLDIISAKEEARLAVLGCHILLEPGDGPALIFDIGGGSTELVLISNHNGEPEILDWKSVPWGVVSLTESEKFDVDDQAARLRAYANMRDRVMESFRSFAGRLPEGSPHSNRLLGTSGTVTTLASLHLQLPCYNRDAIDGLIVPSEAMRDISQRLASISPEERRDLPCIGKERADLVVAGCAILECIMDIWPADRLGIADRGIREGILRALMGPQIETVSPAVRNAAL